MNIFDFLPISCEQMRERGWYYYDFLIITGDAYVDHPSFGAAVIGRVLEAEGFRVAVLAQPRYKDISEIEAMGKPRFAALVTAGNLDSMVAHYTAAKKPRGEDFYSPGKKTKLRPDRASIVYSKLLKEAFPGLPIILGGLEASLRRFAHYDYWSDRVMRPIVFDTGADILVYGMGEAAITEIAHRLSGKEAIGGITDVRGTAYVLAEGGEIDFPAVSCASYEQVLKNKTDYARAAMVQYDEHDPVSGRAVVQNCSGEKLVVNPPGYTLTAQEIDRIYALPFTREVHPKYNKLGGVAAIDEVRFSIIHNRGCFGACNFCALAFHQGRTISSRSHESVISEAKFFAKHPDFKGYIHDVGGPTANFRYPSCKIQLKKGMCIGRNCLAPEPCKHLNADHSDYLHLLRKLRKLPGIKKVFVRSGIRFDYLMCDKSGEFFSELVKYHISGQLKVAPEHCVNKVLDYMGKPGNQTYQRFSEKYSKLNSKYGKQQFLVPYLISSHPGSTVGDAIELAEYLNKSGRQPEQVQDFYPTPGTLSTCMYYTEIDPRTMERLYVPKSPKEKSVQRALLQWKKPENRAIVTRALRDNGRGDLVGYGRQCLVKPQKQTKTVSKQSLYKR